MVFKKAAFGLKAYRLYSRAWDWWQTVVKAWKERNMPDEGGVAVKSAWSSKVNWTVGIQILASVLTFFGLNLDTETQAALLAIINGVGGVLAWYFRTFKTTSLTKGSVQ